MQSRKARVKIGLRRVNVAFGKLIFARRAKFEVNFQTEIFIFLTLIIHPIPFFVNKKFQETNI